MLALLILNSPSNNTKRNGPLKLPQVAETNTPRMMDAAGEHLLYYEFSPNVHRMVYGFQALQMVLVRRAPTMMVTLIKALKLKENPYEKVL